MLRGVPPGRPRGQRRRRLGKDPHEAGPRECRSRGVAPAAPDPRPKQTAALGLLLPRFLKQVPAGQRAASLPGSLALGQVHEPICFLPAFYNGIKYGMHTPRHTRSHGNQTTGPTLPSPTQSTPAPGCLPEPRDVRQGPVRTTCHTVSGK